MRFLRYKFVRASAPINTWKNLIRHLHWLPVPSRSSKVFVSAQPAECDSKGSIILKNNCRLGRRRSQRVTLKMVVMVSESQPGTDFPLERAYTVSVSRFGGLITLRNKVNWGQRLLLTNPLSRVTQPCRVVHLGPERLEKRQVGVEFLDPLSDLWNVTFPALDLQADQTRP